MNRVALPTFILNDLEQVEARILQRLEARAALMRAVGLNPFAAGNGAIRAALTLLSAQLGSYDLRRVLHAAAAVELIHAATTVHEGIMRDGDHRAGPSEENGRWNSDAALMIGDYLFALAATEMAQAPDSRIITYFSRSVMSFCEGELSPVTSLKPLEAAVNHYLSVIGAKTAALFEASCKAGLVCAGGAQEQVDALGRFGYSFGLAYRIARDVHDLIGDDSITGQPRAASLHAGTITLPLIYALDAAPNPALAELPLGRALSRAQIGALIADVRRSGAAERALTDALRYADLAAAQLEAFADGPARRALIDLARAATGSRGVGE